MKKLQIRIAKATLNQQWRRVKALQHMLTHSFSARAITVKRVTENTGKRTPRIDGEVWRTSELKWKAISRIKRRGYSPKPLRMIYIPKSNGKRRPLGIPVMVDRAMQALWFLALEVVAETQANPNSYGFRTGRGTADAMQKIFINLA